jgi:hypothetical protein
MDNDRFPNATTFTDIFTIGSQEFKVLSKALDPRMPSSL